MKPENHAIRELEKLKAQIERCIAAYQAVALNEGDPEALKKCHEAIESENARLAELHRKPE